MSLWYFHFGKPVSSAFFSALKKLSSHSSRWFCKYLRTWLQAFKHLYFQEDMALKILNDNKGGDPC